jgi:rod shape-determining protein MreC
MFKASRTQSKLLGYMLLAIVLIFADYNFPQTQQVRIWMTLLVTPIQWLVDLPGQTWTRLNELVMAREHLLEQNRQLRIQNLLDQRQIQKLAALTVENYRLRGLLNAAEKLDETVILSELIGLNPDPFVHQVIINSGSEDGVVLGQPVIDSTGVMGQVCMLGPYTSRVLLVSDSNHAIPVQINRNGLRTVAYGQGNYDYLALADLADTEDIQVGDILVSSGLGLRFPVGYPVAEVTEVIHDPGRAFAQVKAKPTAQLSNSRQLLLVQIGYKHRPADLDLSNWNQ